MTAPITNSPPPTYLKQARGILVKAQSSDPHEVFAFKDEHLEVVLRITNQTETRIKRIVSKYIQPKIDRALFLESILLSNSIVSLGAKFKLLFAIADALAIKPDRNAFHTFLSRRNALAHQDFADSIDLKRELTGEIGVEVMVESIKGNGVRDRMTREKALVEFLIALEAIESGLASLEDRLKIR